MESEEQQENISNLDECTPTVCLYLDRNDVVRCKNCGEIGRVTKFPNEFDESNSLSPDEIEVLWENEVQRECEDHNAMTLVSKGLLYPGTFISSALDPFGRHGVIINVNTSVDLLTSDGSIIEGVDSKELIQIKDIYFGRFAVLGPWIGRVVDIVENVTVLLDNGSISEFTETNLSCLKPVDGMNKIDKNIINYSGYYPGQRVKALLFLSLWKPESLEGTVTKVSVESVQLQWFEYVGQGGDDFLIKMPDKKQCPEKLKILDFFEDSTWLLFAGCRLNNVEGVFKIISLKKKVDVVWQDGTIEKGLDSCSFIVEDDLRPTRLFPQQFVRMKNTQEENDGSQNGFVISVNSKEKTALVRWQNEGGREVSIYEIERHPERNYFYGDFVGWLPHYIDGEVIDHPHIGTIIGIENGLIDVVWMNGTVSKVSPEDIFDSVDIVRDDDEEEEEEEDDYYYDDSILEFEGSNIFYVNNFVRNIVRVPNVIFSWGIKHLNRFRLKSNGEENEGQCQRILVDSATIDFDVIEDPSDHYFVGEEQQSTPRKWLKKVQEDWRTLQNDLPDGIFVRVYEDRMDLLRAMIEGPYGTPYQDGLFFFDFHLPPEYPDLPPEVHYHSGGWKLNPNLYEDGKICLSLLNTWHGEGNEVWDSSSSSILQVLISIQGLVLNSKPYFNEAGYDNLVGSPEGENGSLSYNEDAYLLNCKRMMNLMRHPLKGFEELAREHFISRGYYILKACDAYMKGYQIGSLTKDASPDENSKQNANSLGLKITLANNIAPKLFLALDEVGADCHDFMYLKQT